MRDALIVLFIIVIWIVAPILLLSLYNYFIYGNVFPSLVQNPSRERIGGTQQFWKGILLGMIGSIGIFYCWKHFRRKK